MSLIYEWARVVALAVLFAGLIEMLITSEDMARFVRLILGMVVLLAMISPALTLADRSWLHTDSIITLGQDPLAAGNRAWHKSVSGQIGRLMESIEGLGDIQVRVFGNVGEGITSIQLRGRISGQEQHRTSQIEKAITTTLAAYYGVLEKYVELQLEVDSPTERGDELHGR